MTMRSAQVRVPATVGNFQNDSTSTAALEGSLNVKVTLRDDGQVGIRYFGENGERVPRGRSNLVVRAMESALRSTRFTSFAPHSGQRTMPSGQRISAM